MTSYNLRAAELGSDHLGARATFKPWPESTITDTLKRVVHGYNDAGDVWVQVERLMSSDRLREFDQYGGTGFTLKRDWFVTIEETTPTES